MATVVVKPNRRCVMVAGTTAVIVSFDCPTVMAFDTPGLAASYQRVELRTKSPVVIPLVSAQAGRWKAGGLAGDPSSGYELGLPDAAVAVDATSLIVSLTQLVFMRGHRVPQSVLGLTLALVPPAPTMAEIEATAEALGLGPDLRDQLLAAKLDDLEARVP